MNGFHSPTRDSDVGRRRFVIFGVLILAVLSLFQDAEVTGRLLLQQGQRYISEEATAKAVVSSEYSSLCTTNPYAPSLNKTLTEIANDADTWLESIPQYLVKASNSTTMSEHNHERFFPFDPMATCEESCIGGPCRRDVSKIACGVNTLKDGCIVYSIGGNNQWEFEVDVLEKTPCEVHTFDCTGNITRFQKPENDRLFFHHVCLGDKYIRAPEPCEKNHQVCGETMTIEGLQKQLGHKRIDLLKMDVEGFEWPVFESWPTLFSRTSLDMVLPYQILVEVHYRTRNRELTPFLAPRDFKFARDIVMLQQRLLQMGYATIVRDDNRICGSCSELTLVRFRCQT